MATQDLQHFADALAPAVYGALGACVYLLRSLHVHIYDRTFDRRHKPEYVDRVVLGTVSGGVIMLFAKELKFGSLNAQALGFLAGYSTDLLFSALERILGALLPKPPDTPKS